MSPTLNVHLLPALTSPEALRDATVVVIDVLRATTTITHALAAGAEAVIPCGDIDRARELAAQLPGDSVCLGGERQGVKIEGFDLGNSPAEYSAEIVAGKTVVFTTTNGTQAMEFCREATRVFIGAFVNLAATCALLREASDVHLLCSGTQKKVTREDVLLAGALAGELEGNENTSWTMNDQARLAVNAWHDVESRLDQISLAQQLRDSQGGRNVTALGLKADIDAAAELDQFDLVGELDLNSWQIRSA